MKKARAVLLVGGLMLASASQAGIVTLSANDFASGTDISNSFSDVALSSFARDLTKEPTPGLPVPYVLDPVYAVSCPACIAHGSSTSVAFGASKPAGLDTQWTNAEFAAGELTGVIDRDSGFIPWNALLVRFDQPTNFVEIAAAGYNGNALLLDAWNASGAHLGRCFYLPPPLYRADEGCSLAPPADGSSVLQTVAFSSDGGDIAFITAGGWDGGRYIESVSYGVPEPSVLALFAVGAGALLWRRRRRNDLNAQMHQIA